MPEEAFERLGKIGSLHSSIPQMPGMMLPISSLSPLAVQGSLPGEIAMRERCLILAVQCQDWPAALTCTFRYGKTIRKWDAIVVLFTWYNRNTRGVRDAAN